MTLLRRSVQLARGPAVALISLLAVATPPVAAQAPTASSVSWLVSADWLQAGALTLDRSTMPSTAVFLERRSENVATQFGYLRAVREMSTVQGGYSSIGRLMRSGPATVFAGLGVLVGQVQASVDTSGYRYTANGVSGYQSRFTYASSVAVGTGVQLAVALALGNTVELRASVAEWAFNGKALKGDNARLLAGAGFAIHLPSRTVTPSTGRGASK
jgi:hypothetical protein